MYCWCARNTRRTLSFAWESSRSIRNTKFSTRNSSVTKLRPGRYCPRTACIHHSAGYGLLWTPPPPAGYYALHDHVVPPHSQLYKPFSPDGVALEFSELPAFGGMTSTPVKALLHGVAGPTRIVLTTAHPASLRALQSVSKPGATRHSNAFRAQPLHVANKNIPGPFSLLGTPLRMSEFTVLTCHTLQNFRHFS